MDSNQNTAGSGNQTQGAGDRLFSQKEVNDIVSARLAEDRSRRDTELAALRQEYDDYKASITKEQTDKEKKAALSRMLEEEGASANAISLLMKAFDMDQIELDGDKIKNWDATVKPVKAEYSNWFGKIITIGANVANPPMSRPTSDTEKKMRSAMGLTNGG